MLVLSVAIVVLVVVAAVLLQPDNPRRRGRLAAGPTPAPPPAPSTWVADLAPRVALSVPVLLEDELLLPGTDRTVPGVEGAVHQATRFPGGLLVTWAPPEAGARLSFLTDKGVLEDFGGATTYGHAVDATGTRVAFGSQTHRDVRAVRAGTGRRLAATTDANQAGLPGTAVGWWHDKVLLTTGDGADVRAMLWDTAEGGVEQVGRPGRYPGAFAVAGDLGVLRQGDSGCSEAIDLQTSAVRWSTCDRFAGASPKGTRVLVQQQGAPGTGAYQVREAATGATRATLALPEDGVVAVGWGSEDTVVAVVRYVVDREETWVVVSCPTDGARCHRVHQHEPGSPTSPGAGQVFVVSAHS